MRDQQTAASFNERMASVVRWFNIIVYDLDLFNRDIARHISGRLLDIGCGRKQEMFLTLVDRYIGLNHPSSSLINREDARYKTDVFGDALRLPFVDRSFDSVLALSLLEHVPEPQQVLNEAYRVLRKGGVFAATVPFYNRIHLAPYDYFRFTEYGIRYLVEQAGFKVVGIRNGGGMWKSIGARLAGYIYSDILGLGYGSDDLQTRPKKYLLPFFLPVIALIVIIFRGLDKLHCVDKDTLHYYILCRKE